MTLIQKAFSGSIAAFFACFVLCPAELVKCRMQTVGEMEGRRHLTSSRIIRAIYRTEGFRGFFRGITPTITRDVPGYFFFFGGYETTRYLFTQQLQQQQQKQQRQQQQQQQQLTQQQQTQQQQQQTQHQQQQTQRHQQYSLEQTNETHDIGLVRTIIAGGVGGLSFWAACYPVDVIKTRMQVTNGYHRNNNTYHVVRMLAREGGLLVFYRGIGLTLVRSFPSNGALFLFYEYSKQFMYWTL